MTQDNKNEIVDVHKITRPIYLVAVTRLTQDGMRPNFFSFGISRIIPINRGYVIDSLVHSALFVTPNCVTVL